MKDGKPAADSKQVRVAIAQSAPAYLDKRASLAKALDLIQQAAKRGAQLVAFGETWLPGYPVWLDVCPGAALWENASAKDVFARWIPVPETGHSTIRFSLFQKMDSSETTIGSSSRPTRNASCGETVMAAGWKHYLLPPGARVD